MDRADTLWYQAEARSVSTRRSMRRDQTVSAFHRTGINSAQPPPSSQTLLTALDAPGKQRWTEDTPMLA